MITVEMGSPERAGRHRFRELGVYDDGFLPGLERLVAVLHDAGARASVHLGHGGSRAQGCLGRNWLYYGARRGTGPSMRQLAREDQKVLVIGDAAHAGKARDAIDDAFRAALLRG
jgi:2,4-dienoyl-CoA reductase-like NADH-dependent reductase (Old Yellow Enzyme family)